MCATDRIEIDVISEEKRFGLLEFKVSADVHAGFVRLFLPWTLIERYRGEVGPEELSAAAHEAWIEWARHGIQRLGDTPVVLSVRIGRTELTGSELRGIGPGDVILIEDFTLDGSLQGGRAFLHAGVGHRARVAVKVEPDDGHFALQLERFESLNEPRMTADKKGGREMPDEEPGKENLRETADLLADVPVVVHVELGRLEMKADRVVALHTGQILRLHRGPGDPVDLVVNGKLIAEGELVQVDGQVGVRVMKIR